MSGINTKNVLSLTKVKKQIEVYTSNGRQSAMSSGSILPRGMKDEQGVLTGNFQLIEYTKEDVDYFLCLGEIKVGNLTDTSIVDVNDKRVKKDVEILVSVVDDKNGTPRNKIKFA
jgi:hypothetical protein